MRRSNLFLFCIIALTNLLLMSGCLRLSKKAPEKRFYALEVERPEKSPPLTTGTLLIRKLQISPAYEGKGLVYRNRQLEYDSDFYNEFFVAPSAMITEEVSQWLEASGLFQHVMRSTTQVNPTHVLEGSVAQLFGDFTDPANPRAILEIQFFLSRAGDRSEIIFQNTYKQDVRLKVNSPEAVVAGFNEALRAILRQFEYDLRTKVRWEGVLPAAKQATAPR